eukprot:GHVH01016006.1.p1 GENE.GHVH01016006.1~~GHVH01016006.1.p1  ORF type:complete len:1499 (-),score=225.38 GHVH01016006.1:2017-6513(-)
MISNNDVTDILLTARKALLLLTPEELASSSPDEVSLQRKIADEKLSALYVHPRAWELGSNLIESVVFSENSSWGGAVLNDAELSLYLGFKFMRESIRSYPRAGKALDPRWSEPLAWASQLLEEICVGGGSKKLFPNLTKLPVAQLAALISSIMVATYGRGWPEEAKLIHLLLASSEPMCTQIVLEIYSDLSEEFVILENDPVMGSRRRAIESFWSGTLCSLMEVMRKSFETQTGEILFMCITTLKSVISACPLHILESDDLSVSTVLHQCCEKFSSQLDEESDFRSTILFSLTGLLSSSTRKNGKRYAYGSLSPGRRAGFLMKVLLIYESLYPPTKPLTYEDEDLVERIPFWNSMKDFVEKNYSFLIEDGTPPRALLSAFREGRQDSDVNWDHVANVWDQFVRRIFFRGVSHNYAPISSVSMQCLTILYKKAVLVMSSDALAVESYSLWCDPRPLVYLMMMRAMRVSILLKESSKEPYNLLLKPLMIRLSEVVLSSFLTPHELQSIISSDGLLSICGPTEVGNDDQVGRSSDEVFEVTQVLSTLKSSVGSLIQTLCCSESIRVRVLESLESLQTMILDYAKAPVNPMEVCPVMAAILNGSFKPLASSKVHMWLSPSYIIFDALVSLYEPVLLKSWSYLRMQMAEADPQYSVRLHPYPISVRQDPLPRWVRMILAQVTEMVTWNWVTVTEESTFHMESRRLEFVGTAGALLHHATDHYPEVIQFRDTLVRYLFSRIDAPFDGNATDVYGANGVLTPSYSLRRTALYALMKLIETIPSAFVQIAENLATRIHNRLNDFNLNVGMRTQEKNLLTEAFICIINATYNYQIQQQFFWNLLEGDLQELTSNLQAMSGEKSILEQLWGTRIHRSKEEEEAFMTKRRELTRTLGHIDVILKRIKLPRDASTRRSGGFLVPLESISLDSPYKVKHPLEMAFIPLIVSILPFLQDFLSCCRILSETPFEQLDTSEQGMILKTFFQPGEEEVLTMTGSINHVSPLERSRTMLLGAFPPSKMYMVDTASPTEVDDYVIIGRRHAFHIRTLLLRIVGRVFDHSPRAIVESDRVVQSMIQLIRTADASVLATIAEMYIARCMTDETIAQLLVPTSAPTLTERAPCQCYLVDRSAPWLPSNPLRSILLHYGDIIEAMDASIRNLVVSLQVNVEESGPLSETQIVSRSFRVGVIDKVITLFTSTLHKLVQYKFTITAQLSKIMVPSPECTSPADPLEPQWKFEDEMFDNQRAMAESKRVIYNLSDGSRMTSSIANYALTIVSTPFPTSCREAHILIRTIAKTGSRQFIPALGGSEVLLNDVFKSVLEQIIINPPSFEPLDFSSTDIDSAATSLDSLPSSQVVMYTPVVNYLIEKGTSSDDSCGGTHVANSVSTLFELLIAMVRVVLSRDSSIESKKETIAQMTCVLLELPHSVDSYWLESVIEDTISNDPTSYVATSGVPAKNDHFDCCEYRGQLRHVIYMNLMMKAEDGDRRHSTWIRANAGRRNGSSVSECR